MPLDALLAHPDVARLARRLALSPGKPIHAEGAMRYAAIALVLRASPAGEPELLMIRRAEYENDPWSGHVACPGGRMDPTDRDLEHTAVRETWEETGIDLARDGRILGTLDDITPRTPSLPPLVIRPFVAVVRPDVALIESEEVAEVFWVPIGAIQETARWGKAFVPIRGVGEREVDVFRHGEHTVWGLTHRALSQFLDLLTDSGGELP
ncbi:MAG TPA: CoA pyrophosphatase [Gemmatimonadaceae bacterium]|nr:CoA pyrophosphatase [Gemmatimonadaceae bacterium]